MGGGGDENRMWKASQALILQTKGPRRASGEGEGGNGPRAAARDDRSRVGQGASCFKDQPTGCSKKKKAILFRN